MKIKKLGKNSLIIVIISIFFLSLLNISPIKAEDKKNVRVSCGVNNSLYLDSDGNPAGFCAVYLQQLAWINGWTLEYVEGNWNESVQNLYDNKIDILFPTQKDAEREQTMGFSSYIGGYQPIGLYANSDASIYYDDFASFNNSKIAVSKDSSNETALAAYAKEHNFTYTPVYYDSTSDKNKALNNGDIDLVVYSTLNDIKGGKEVAIIDYLPFYYTTRKEDTVLLNELNSGMETLMNTKPNVVSNVYENVLRGNNVKAFTASENETIKNTKSITVGLYKDTFPLSGFDENGNASGIYVDLLKEIEKYTSIKIEFYPIKRNEYSYDLLEKGKIDFVIGSNNLRNDAADPSKFLQTESLTDYTTVAITEANYSFDDTKTKTFALTKLRKYYEDYINEKYPNSKIKYYDDVKDCLIAIQDGKADITFINSWEYNYQSKNARFSDLMEWESIRLDSGLILGALRDSDPNILSIVDKAISSLSVETKNNIVTKNLNMKYQSYTLSDDLYTSKNYIIIFGIILAIIIIFFIVYTYTRRKYTKELETANNTKSKFLSRMSHELRTPLNAINGYTELLKTDEKDPNKTEKLMMIENSSDYLLTLINDILDIQKIETGQIPLHKEVISSRFYLKNIINIITPLMKDKNINFEFERASDNDSYFYADGKRIEQVLLAILDNAIKFTPEGGSIYLSTRCKQIEGDKETIEFAVKDTGIGMEQDFVDNKLFGSFNQEDNSINSKYSGSGIGLSIAKKIINSMDGDITCISKKNEGSTFTITIIVDRVDKPKEKNVSYDLHNINILLCEDNEINQEMTKRLLKKFNANVEIAENGKVGLEMFNKQPDYYYSIILMDIRMPEMDGYEATKAIRHSDNKDAKTIPILALSANAFEEDVQNSLSSGMNEHLSKPINGKPIYNTICKYLTK